MDDKVNRLQEHLSLIRNCAGWSASELGNKLGVSRQMISNLENNHNKMTRMQYLAIRQVLNDELENSKENNDTQMLNDIIKVLIDEPESFTPKQREQVLSDAELLAPSIGSKKTSRKKASNTWALALAGSLIATMAVAATAIVKSKEGR